MRDRQTLLTAGKKIRRKKFTLLFLPISLFGLMATAVLDTETLGVTISLLAVITALRNLRIIETHCKPVYNI
jgi:hypothetical protein